MKYQLSFDTARLLPSTPSFLYGYLGDSFGHRRKHISNIALFMFFLTPGASATAGTQFPPGTFNLIEVHRLALVQDARLNAARHDYLAQNESVAQARSGLLPTLSAGANIESSSTKHDGAGSARKRSGVIFHATLNQPLVRLDRWYAFYAASSGSREARLRLADKEQRLILESAEVYFNTLRAMDTRASAKAEALALERQKQQAEAQLDNGVANLADVLEARAAHDNAIANRQAAERAVQDAFEALGHLTGEAPSMIAGLAHQMPSQPPFPAQPAAWVEQALQNNLALQASEYAVNAAQQRHRERKAGHAPTLDATAAYRRGDNDRLGYGELAQFGHSRSNGNVVQQSITLELNIPLYAGGLTSSQVREAGHRLVQVEYDRDEQRRRVVEDTRNFYRAVNTDIDQVQARFKNIVSSQASLKANKRGRELGTRTFTDILNSERQLYRTIRQYNDARYDYILNTLRLKQVSGNLSSEDILEISRYLVRSIDPDKHFLPPAAAIHPSPS